MTKKTTSKHWLYVGEQCPRLPRGIITSIVANGGEICVVIEHTIQVWDDELDNPPPIGEDSKSGMDQELRKIAQSNPPPASFFVGEEEDLF